MREMLVSSKDKRRAKKIAASKWNMVNQEYLDMPLSRRVEFAKRLIEEDILASRNSIGNKKGFGSVFTTLLLHLIIKIAMKWIDRWLEEKLFSVPEED
jgi:hypothetical protein